MPSKCLKELNKLLENKLLKFTDQISNNVVGCLVLQPTAQFIQLKYTCVVLVEHFLSISLGQFLSCDYTCCRSLLSNMLMQFLAGMLGSTHSKFYALRVLGSSEKCVLHIINYS